MSRSLPYRSRASPVFGHILRPLIDVEIRSKILNEWTRVENVLADTGADASLLPRSLGSVLVGDITTGKRSSVGSVVPGAKLDVYVHDLTYRLGRRGFSAPTFIADSDACPAILGRIGALDRWRAKFAQGRRLRIRQ